jgi:hypothetical protein
VGHGLKFMPGKNCLGANMLIGGNVAHTSVSSIINMWEVTYKMRM